MAPWCSTERIRDERCAVSSDSRVLVRLRDNTNRQWPSTHHFLELCVLVRRARQGLELAHTCHRAAHALRQLCSCCTKQGSFLETTKSDEHRRRTAAH